MQIQYFVLNMKYHFGSVLMFSALNSVDILLKFDITATTFAFIICMAIFSLYFLFFPLFLIIPCYFIFSNSKVNLLPNLEIHDF